MFKYNMKDINKLIGDEEKTDEIVEVAVVTIEKLMRLMRQRA